MKKWEFSIEKEADKYTNCVLCGTENFVYAAKAIKGSGSATLNICKDCISEMNIRVNIPHTHVVIDVVDNDEVFYGTYDECSKWMNNGWSYKIIKI